jgi:hypothetical protein
VDRRVDIRQKVVRLRPIDKLLDAFIMMLAGGRGLVEVNTRVRPDALLQLAFGWNGCADQSTVRATLNACTNMTVEQMREALKDIMQQHSRACDHDYEAAWQVLDVGLPAGEQGEGVSRGYFADGQSKRGRQLGRVLASRYGEIVYEQLYAGKQQLHHGLSDLVSGAENVLVLQRLQRQRTLVLPYTFLLTWSEKIPRHDLSFCERRMQCQKARCLSQCEATVKKTWRNCGLTWRPSIARLAQLAVKR